MTLLVLDHSPKVEPAARNRSPAYPNIALKTALVRVVELEAYCKGNPVRPETIGNAWGIKGRAYIYRTVAALRYFGLVEYQGTAKDRWIALSENGRRYVRAQGMEEKAIVVKAIALRPRNIAKFWDLWGVNRPSENECLDDLVVKFGFTRNGARTFLRVYDETIALFAEAETDRPTMPAGNDPHRHQVFFPLPEGDVSLTFPADMSVDSAQTMTTLIRLALNQALDRAQKHTFSAAK
jgi:hypothetical protein